MENKILVIVIQTFLLGLALMVIQFSFYAIPNLILIALALYYCIKYIFGNIEIEDKKRNSQPDKKDTFQKGYWKRLNHFKYSRDE